ncbi:cytochrome c oxidase subunit 2A [Cohnella faecalis]|uniref:Cytochrome c oxidase subunit 2A n=1 Tax=Cohnella faecalis TaxID=2315694 RepID=A0A398CRJ6_9BACL|nr:cytochrome c oxidase subunit 2A [Cohnella faecalis]RIE05162.1 cytochrome c oxidase subunit 2A [Cohnella faecalis]
MSKDRLPSENREEPSLKGTFVSVLLLAGFIVVTWLAVFFLFVSRG